MKFTELDNKLRVYETAADLCVLPGIYMVARIDGRNFTRLTKETHRFEVPFDERFRDYMVSTVAHLMDCGFRVIYGYTQSDEISLLLDPNDDVFGRKLRKLNSVLAGEASARFSTLVGGVACFDCRISQLPNVDLVVDYFRWRNEDACRNALSSHCYWALRQRGDSATQASRALHGLGVAAKNELLYEVGGLNFTDVVAWQKRGTGLYWETYTKPARNALTGEEVLATRRRLVRDYELPMKDAYEDFVRQLIVSG